MQRKHNPQLVSFAKELRKDMTKEERKLWYEFLRSYPVRFTRQKVLGRYIADFYCAQAGIVIELDGSQHYETAGRMADAQRDADLRTQGLTVLRYSNADVNYRFEEVCQDIWNHLQ